mgnify:CR=1 FL=1
MLYGYGCSFTDESFESQYPDVVPYPKWPELVSSKLDLDFMNFGLCGISNDEMKDTFLDTVVKKKPKVAMFLFTQWERVKVLPTSYTRIKLGKNCYESGMCDICKKLGFYKCWLSKLFHENNNKDIDKLKYHQAINNFRIYYEIQEWCKRNDIKYILVQGLNAINLEHQYVKSLFKNNPYIDLLDTKKIWGYPFVENLGGRNVFNEMSKEEIIYGHPNQLGQEKLANIFYELYKKNYRD